MLENVSEEFSVTQKQQNDRTPYCRPTIEDYIDEYTQFIQNIIEKCKTRNKNTIFANVQKSKCVYIA